MDRLAGLPPSGDVHVAVAAATILAALGLLGLVTG